MRRQRPIAYCSDSSDLSCCLAATAVIADKVREALGHRDRWRFRIMRVVESIDLVDYNDVWSKSLLSPLGGDESAWASPQALDGDVSAHLRPVTGLEREARQPRCTRSLLSAAMQDPSLERRRRSRTPYF